MITVQHSRKAAVITMKQATVIILAGQSNAVGVGHVQYLPKYFPSAKIAEFEAGYPAVPINYLSHDKRSGGFVPTGLGCTERSKNTLGPEVGLAERLSELCPGRDCFIVKCAVGGTSLWRDWLSPSSGGDYDPEAYAPSPEEAVYSINNGVPMSAGWCYNELVKLTRESLAVLEGQGYIPVIRGFCWMQGEADACDPATMADYGVRYDRMVKDFAAAFAPYVEDCRFIYAGISEIWPLYREMNAFKSRYAAERGDCVFVDTVAHGLTTRTEPEGEVDIYHYDCGSTVELGRLFADALGLG